MKVLDRYILFTFVKTFVSIFTILMFIFLLQSVWLYIQELSGRDLDFEVILKFLVLAAPSLVVLVLPLSILLTSIMTFGNFAENYEFAAMKSTGISLQRAMGTVIIFVFIIGITSFLFANHVIPASQYEFRNLRRNIAKLKPAMALREGQFNEMGENYNIKIADKYGDRDQYLTDVVIHKKDKRRIGNYTVIKANKGELISSEDAPVLSLQLQEGNYYDDVYKKDIKEKKKEPFVKSYFETYTINIDLSELDNVDLDEKEIDNSYQMLNVKALDSVLDNLSKDFNKKTREFGVSFARKSNLTPLDISFEVTPQDSIKPYLLDNYTSKENSQILNTALSSVKNSIISINNRKVTNKVDLKRVNKFEIAIHEKYVLGFSCIILFFIGAPLGAIIRKGGLGLPIVIGVVFFLVFHFVGIFAKNSAEDGSVSAFLASWINVLIVFPISIYLTHRATTDQGLFDLDGFLIPIKRFFGVKQKKPQELEDTTDYTYTITDEEEAMLEARSTNQLKDIVKNYEQYSYSEDIRNAAISKLSILGISVDNLKVQGYFENKSFATANDHFKNFTANSKHTLIFYTIAISLSIPFIFIRVVSSEAMLMVFLVLKILSAIAALLYIIFLSLSSSYYIKFYKSFDKDKSLIVFFFGGVIYFFMYPYFKKRMKEQLEMI